MANMRPEAIVRHLHQVAGGAARDLTDTQLLERFVAEREQEAFAALVKRHGPMVWGVCRHLTRREHDAEDAFQAVFLVLARRGSAIKKREAVGSWLYGVAYRIAMKANQRQTKRQARERVAARSEEARDADGGWRELQAHLDEALLGLPERYRAPFVLCCLEGRPRKDVAKELGVLEGTVSSRIARARALLQDALSKRGVTLSAALLAGELWRQTASAMVPAAVAKAAVGLGTGGAVPAAVAALAHGMEARTMGRVIVGLLVLLTGLTTAAIGYAPPAQKEPQPQAQKAVDAEGDPLPADALARLGTVRFRPGSHVKHLEFTPDGKRLITFGPWCGVHVWDAATGRELATLPSTRDDWVGCGFLARDGATIYCTERKGPEGVVVRQRRVADMQQVAEFEVGNLQPMGLSPDGRLLLGHLQDTKGNYALELWDVTAGKKVRAWPAHKDSVRGHAFSADGTTLVSGGGDKVIRFWDVETGAKRFEITDHPDIVGLLALSADGATLASVGMTNKELGGGVTAQTWNNRIRVWDVKTRKERHHLDMPMKLIAQDYPAGFCALAFAADGKTLVSAGHDGAVRFWDAAAGKAVRDLTADAKALYAFAFAPDGKTLALATDAVRILNAADGKDKVTLAGHRSSVLAAVPLADGRTVATMGDGKVVLWDRKTGRPRRTLVDHDGLLARLHALPDGRTLAGMDALSALVLWDAASGREVRRVGLSKVTYGAFTVSPDGTTAVVHGADKAAVLIDLATGKEVARLPASGDGGLGAGFSPDGKRLYVYAHDHTWAVWDLTTRKAVGQFEFADAPAAGGNAKRLAMPAGGGKRGGLTYGARVSPDGRRIAYGSQQGYLALHDAETGKAVRVIDGLGDGPCVFAFSPDGRSLAWAPWSRPTVHVLEVGSGKERKRLVGHRGRVVALAFAADGRTLVSGSEDTTALVWDVLGAGASEPLGGADLDRCWADLADADAAKAFAAMRRLAACPDTVAHLRKRLVPVPAVAAERLARLIADLDSDTFADRERASRELEKLDDLAAEACRKALAGKPSAELRKRLSRLLAPIDAQAEVLSPDRLRLVRAVEVLERLPSPDAAAILKALAGGAPGAFLTRQAADAVRRGERR